MIELPVLAIVSSPCDCSTFNAYAAWRTPSSSAMASTRCSLGAGTGTSTASINVLLPAALSMLQGYRERLDRVFRPEIGEELFVEVVYSRLAEVGADNTQDCKKKTYNNITGALRTAFKFGYKDLPGEPNPTLALPSFRITMKDRPKVDPFTIQDAESIIAASHRKWYGDF